MKYIKGFENYLISKSGLIYSIKRKKLINQFADKYGYMQVVLYNGKYQSFRVHRLVALAYLENANNHKVVNHLNGIKIDNRVDNLEWCSIKENVNHSWQNGLSENIRNASSKIVLDTNNGIFYNSAREASKCSNYAYSTLRSMLNGGLKNNTSLVYV